MMFARPAAIDAVFQCYVIGLQAVQASNSMPVAKAFSVTGFAQVMKT